MLSSAGFISGGDAIPADLSLPAMLDVAMQRAREVAPVHKSTAQLTLF